MSLHLANLREFFFWQSGYVNFLVFLFIVEGIYSLFKRDYH